MGWMEAETRILHTILCVCVLWGGGEEIAENLEKASEREKTTNLKIPKHKCPMGIDSSEQSGN